MPDPSVAVTVAPPHPIPPAAPVAPAPPHPRLVGPAGVVIDLDGSVVIGRDPRPDAATMRRVAVDDPARSMSKTHARFDVVAGAVHVVDLHSTNGVRVLRAGGAVVDVEPGAPIPVADGETVLLGDVGFRLDLAPSGTV